MAEDQCELEGYTNLPQGKQGEDSSRRNCVCYNHFEYVNFTTPFGEKCGFLSDPKLGCRATAFSIDYQDFLFNRLL